MPLESDAIEYHDEIHEALHRDAKVDYTKVIVRNGSAAVLYEHALVSEKGSAITSSGALVTESGKKTGRSPRDKRIVSEDASRGDIWWGPVNFPMESHSFMVNRERAIDYLNTRDTLFVFDGFAGWDPEYRIKVRVVCARAYHSLFMNNMLISPTKDELTHFGDPDFTILNAGAFPANRYTTGMTSSTSVAISFARKEMVILGTEYAGEMKKGVFTVMHYLMPKRNILSLHSSANEGPNGQVSLFFGLSGTGKTTLSADPKRLLIGDDEHVLLYNQSVGLTMVSSTLKVDATQKPSIYLLKTSRKSMAPFDSGPSLKTSFIILEPV
jgi:ATP-dependent phosphoenolpyruvate carboxykinase